MGRYDPSASCWLRQPCSSCPVHAGDYGCGKLEFFVSFSLLLTVTVLFGDGGGGRGRLDMHTDWKLGFR